MPRHVFEIENGKFGLSLTEPTSYANNDPCTATASEFTDFGCQITSGALNASPNTTTNTVPATWCAPEETKTSVGVTSYSVDLSFLQDPDVVDGLSQFLFEHDTEEAYFYMGMDGDNPPKAIGKVRLTSGTIGGEGRTVLTATVSLPTDGKPLVCFGNSTTSDKVANDATGATGGTPGSWTPATADIPRSLAEANSLGLSLGAAWTTGQYVTLADTGSTHIHWDGNKFATGDAA